MSGGIAGRMPETPFHECLLCFFPPLCPSYLGVRVFGNALHLKPSSEKTTPLVNPENRGNSFVLPSG